MNYCLLALILPTAAAFAPAASAPVSTSLQDSLNGWVPDESKFAFGLPGSLDPKEEFDPLGFADGADLVQMKQYREAETTHGRVAMLAVVGALITEAPLSFHPLFNNASRDIGPSIRHLDEVRVTAPFFFEILAVVIGAAEVGRSLKGWETPGNENNQVLKDDYYPGDIGFDPLGLKPDNFEEFSIMSTKELQHGRLAMLGIAGIVAQELTNGKEIFVNAGLAPDTFDPASLPVQF
mmetsp:Transcript_10389/g.12188  ORF Transcript_10389/g.12188 Transcript_10389/m.12188 type:complete len:236 (-) Transcript_10389:227-934(-)